MRGRLSRHLGGRSVARRRHGTATRPPELRGGRSVSWTTFRTPSPPRQGVLCLEVWARNPLSLSREGERRLSSGVRETRCVGGGYWWMSSARQHP